jgi:hypothetical protein
MAPTFAFIFVTAIAGTPVQATVTPGLSAQECNWMALAAPAAVAEYGRQAGRQLELLEARCEREEG